MTLEGLKEFEAVRDFLYSRMRGVKDPAHAPILPTPPGHAPDAEVASALREVAHELRETRLAWQARHPAAPESPHG